MPTFGIEERRIKKLLSVGEKFYFNREKFTVKVTGKPTSYVGEPKTDVYVYAETYEGHGIELKISFKKENADFLENKTNPKRAEKLFGEQWKNIIIQSTIFIKKKFLSRPIIYKNSYRRTEKGAITLGWKFELLNKPGGELSGGMPLTREQIIDIYAGTSLVGDKRNAKVGQHIIAESGIANYILMNDKVTSAQNIIDNLISIENYVKRYPTVYFACKALNYRTFADKWDGDRPLAVFIDWNITNGKLTPNFIFDRPLLVKGNEVANKLLQCMNRLGIRNTDELNESNVCCNDIIFI